MRHHLPGQTRRSPRCRSSSGCRPPWCRKQRQQQAEHRASRPSSVRLWIAGPARHGAARLRQIARRNGTHFHRVRIASRSKIATPKSSNKNQTTASPASTSGPARGQNERAGHLGHEEPGQRQDEQRPELLGRARVIDARRDEHAHLQGQREVIGPSPRTMSAVFGAAAPAGRRAPRRARRRSGRCSVVNSISAMRRQQRPDHFRQQQLRRRQGRREQGLERRPFSRRPGCVRRSVMAPVTGTSRVITRNRLKMNACTAPSALSRRRPASSPVTLVSDSTRSASSGRARVRTSGGRRSPRRTAARGDQADDQHGQQRRAVPRPASASSLRSSAAMRAGTITAPQAPRRLTVADERKVDILERLILGL